MSDLAGLTLRAWPQGSANAPPSLASLISRINAQEGSFRDVSEEKLIRAIGRTGPNEHSTEENSPPAKDVQEFQSQRERVLEAREDIAKFVNQALTESSHTLDFISLVFTGYNPKQAAFTISPFIKETLPNGCLGSEVVDPLKVSEASKRQNSLVSSGWKLQSVTTAADSILHAASNLEKELEKEAKYWEQVLSAKRTGWPLFRLKQGRGALAVRYGSLEATAGFRGKGVAALRRGDDGVVEVDVGNNPARKSLRIRVREKGSFVAASRHHTPPDESLESSLMQVRNSLFDEELYNEIHREARSLTNRGIKCFSEGVSIPLKGKTALVVDLVDNDEPQPEVQGPSNSSLVTYPDLAATAFRILLSYSHGHNFRQRTEQPRPSKQRKKTRPLPSILLPIMLQLEHQSTLSEVRSTLNAIENTISNAGVAFRLGDIEGSLDLKRFVGYQNEITSSHLIDELMNAICYPPQTTILADVGSNNTTIKISIRTHSNGTEFLVSYTTDATESVLAETPHEMHFYDLSRVQEHICHLVMLELIGMVAAQHPRWEASAPDEGQLVTETTVEGDLEMLTIRLEEGLLLLSWSASNEPEGGARQMQWHGGDDSATKPKSFMEEVDLLSNLRPAVDSF